MPFLREKCKQLKLKEVAKLCPGRKYWSRRRSNADNEWGDPTLLDFNKICNPPSLSPVIVKDKAHGAKEVKKAEYTIF